MPTCFLTGICLITSILAKPVFSQSISRHNTFYIGVNEGLLQSTMLDMAFDRNNFWWLSFPNGIQRFDGKNFLQVPVQHGLPDNKNCRFFKTRNGSLLISHNRGISRYNDHSNRFEWVYRYGVPARSAALFLGEDDGAVYFYSDAAEITGIDTAHFSVRSSFKTGLPDFKEDFTHQPGVSGEIRGRQAAMIINKRIYLWDTKAGSFSYRSALITDISSYLIKPLNDEELLFFANRPTGTLLVLNSRLNRVRSLQPGGLEQTTFGRAGVIRWKDKVLLHVNDRIFETDSSFRLLRSELVNYQLEPPAKNAPIQQLKVDNFGNLFVRTVNGGIRKILANNYPLRYFTNGDPEKNYILALYADKEQNRILAGVANYGLVISDTNQQLKKYVALPGGAEKKLGSNTILKSPAGDYYLFSHEATWVWKLSANLNRLSKIPFITTLSPEKSGTGYFCKLLYQDAEKAVVLSETKIYRLDLKNDRVYEYPSANGYIMSGVHSSPYFIIHYNDELVFLDEQSFKQVKRVPFPNTGGVRCYLNDGQGRLFAGTNKGIFVTDTSGKNHEQWNTETGLPDECIYAMAFDREKNIWCSTNKGIIQLAKGRVVRHLRKEDGLQENEFNTNVVHVTPDGELYFGGINGYNGFYPSSVAGVKDSIHLLMSAIEVNNERIRAQNADWNITSLKLPYHKNALSFDFAAMGNHNPDQYVYQYRMEGVDSRWLQNDKMQSVRYSLAPGRYTLQVYASRSFDENAVPMKEIRILIRPPFWQTWWFRAGLGLLGATLLSVAINRRNRRKYEARLLQLEHDRKIKSEREKISRNLHDNLGAYANAVLYNAELLEKASQDERRKDLIADLKFASKDIITSLRETVWALSKEEYTAEECLIRIKNFIQPLAKYYSQVQFRTTGEAPAGLMLHHTHALNLVRILQEAISNSLKHASPGVISLSSEPAGTQWKLEVSDNGTGFDPLTLPDAEKGNGLRNMEHRAHESGFGLTIHSQPGSGTTITIFV